jgi:hypothetical protein
VIVEALVAAFFADTEIEPNGFVEVDRLTQNVRCCKARKRKRQNNERILKEEEQRNQQQNNDNKQHNTRTEMASCIQGR